MGSVERFLENATSTTLWRSPRGTVLRIEALALVAITFSFFLVAFGSCRRWSNRWIVQRGFLAAHALSLSLGIYSIGLMQSSSVKSEMYPIWAVSLLTLFGCIDPVTTYIGLDYKGPLLKIIFQFCLYCGYVVVISISTISSVVGNLAIGVLSTITFIKGFHRSLALVLPSTKRDEIGQLLSTETSAFVGDGDEQLGVHLSLYLEGTLEEVDGSDCATMADIRKHMGELKLPEVTANGLTIEDVCLGYSLSHLLQRHFLGLSSSKEMEYKIKVFEHLAGKNKGYTRILKVIEVELAFLYEVYFSSNEFLHFYQAKTGSFWALASFIGICFVGVASVIPGTMSSHHRITTSSSGPPGAGTIAVYTTTADLIITLVILLSLALLQLVQLMWSWTSNWARVAFACEYARNKKLAQEQMLEKKQIGRWMWLKLKVLLVTRINWFDKYLWQDKLGQYSVVDAARSRRSCFFTLFGLLFSRCKRLVVKTGAAYILEVLWELLGGDTNGVAAVGLHNDVKTSVADFLGQIKSGRIGKDWSSLFVDNGLDTSCLPYSNAPLELHGITVSDDFSFTHRVMVWHFATRYCELAEKQGGGGEGESDREKNRRVAIALSKYCAYLVASAPELLPGSSEEIKQAFKGASELGPYSEGVDLGKWLRNEEPLPPSPVSPQRTRRRSRSDDPWSWAWGPEHTRRRPDDPWKVLALLWVQTLLYAAPYGDVQAHRQRLSQGGEFITHLWALLYHLGIDKWERE